MDISTVSPNRLLADLTPSDFDLIRPHLRDFELVHGAVLAVAGDELKQAYFPHSGVISLVIRLIQGETTEIAMVGRESIYGSSVALGGPTALTTGIVQSPGTCTVIPSRFLRGGGSQHDIPGNDDPARTGYLCASAAVGRLHRIAFFYFPTVPLVVTRTRRFRKRRIRVHAGIHGSNARRATQRGLAGCRHAAGQGADQVQSGSNPHHRCRRPESDSLRML